MEFGKPHAYHEPMCTSENCQWRGELYFAGNAISIGGVLLQISRWEDVETSHKAVLLQMPVFEQTTI
jgi:hypothetical protein